MNECERTEQADKPTQALDAVVALSDASAATDPDSVCWLGEGAQETISTECSSDYVTLSRREGVGTPSIYFLHLL